MFFTQRAFADNGISSLDYKVISVHKHDPSHFTQGLYYKDGIVYESTGQYRRSKIVMSTLDGEVIASETLPSNHFGEGLTLRDDRIIQLTWKAEVAWLRDVKNLKPIETFHLPYRPWGLTHNDDVMIMSDGTSKLYFLDPETFVLLETQLVRADGNPLSRLNELEWIKGRIWANIRHQDRIAVIDPISGKVVAWLDLSDLAAKYGLSRKGDDLNGIAYDTVNDLVLITGKKWPYVFSLEVEDIK